MVIAATDDTDVEHRRLRGRGAARDARQRRRRAAAVQLHPARDRAHGPAGDRDLHRRRLAGARQAHEARDRRRSSASPTRAWRCCSTRRADGRRARCPTYQDRKEFFEGIVGGDPDPVALLRDGDEQAVRELIARAQSAARAAGLGSARSVAALEVEGLARHYGEREALADVSLSLDAGQTLVVFGPNGAGKTTLLRVLATLLRPHAGERARARARACPQRPGRCAGASGCSATSRCSTAS